MNIIWRLVAVVAWTLFASLITSLVKFPTPTMRMMWMITSICVGVAVAHYLPIDKD